MLGHGTTVFQDLKEYVDSLKKMAAAPDVGRIYPGHGPVIEDGKAKLDEYIKHRQVSFLDVCRGKLDSSDAPMYLIAP